MPLPTYIKEGRPAGPRGAPSGGSPTRTPSPSRLPPSFQRRGGKGKEGRGRRKRWGRVSNSDWVGGGARHLLWHASLSPLWPMRPNNPRGVPVTSRYSKNTRITPELFRCPNITFQYINLYLSTISRLLVMSVFSSGTPNKLRSPKHITHNTNRHRTLSVWTLRVRELCRHDRDTSPVNN